MGILKEKKFRWIKPCLIFLFLYALEKGNCSNVLVSNPCTSSTSDWTFYDNDITNPIQKEDYWLLDADATSDIIQTPIIDAGNYTNLTISFNIANFGNGAFNPALISYSTDGGSTWNPNVTTSITPASNIEFVTSGDINLGTLNTKQLLIRISNNGISGRGVKIKDILLTGSPIIIAPTANNATNITPQSFTANWTKTTGATGYILSVFKTINLTDENFNTIATSSSFVTSGSGASGSLNFGASGWSATNGYSAGGIVRIGTSTSPGSLNTPTLNLSGKFKLTFKSCAWMGDSKTMNIMLNNAIIQTIPIDNEVTDASGMKEYSIFGEGSGSDIISFSAIKASANRFFIDDVRINRLEEIPGSPFAIASSETTSQTIASLSKGTYSYAIKATDNNYTSDESNDIDVSIETTNDISIQHSDRIIPLIFATQDQIHINGISPIGSIEIYNITGIKVMELKTIESKITLPQKSGLYLIKTDLRTMRLLVK